MPDDASDRVERRIGDTVARLSRLRTQELVYRQAMAIEVIRMILDQTPERSNTAVELVSLVEILEHGEFDLVSMPEFVEAHRRHAVLSRR